jgi:hypothetical protein
MFVGLKSLGRRLARPAGSDELLPLIKAPRPPELPDPPKGFLPPEAAEIAVFKPDS